jgi:hypothetical protein
MQEALTMTYGKVAGITAGFVCAFGIGVWTGTQMRDRAYQQNVPAIATAATAPETSAAPAAPRPSARTRAARAPSVAKEDRPTEFTPMKTSMSASAPELQPRIKPLLKPGARLDIAAEGFYSAEQFATVAHASQNTDVPFMLLKHRVLNEGDTLVAAIRKSKPDIDAIAEVDRARAEARADLAQLD